LFAAFDAKPESYGYWGGTSLKERRAARAEFGERDDEWGQGWHGERSNAKGIAPEVLPQIVEAFEQSFERRLELWRERAEAFKVVAAAKAAERRATRAAERNRRSKRFTLGGRPGPGRGHKRKIRRYAEARGISYATAWRRLQAS
jgi:hypothetical protein